MFETTRWWWVRHAPTVGEPGRIYGRSDVAADLSDRAALAAALPRDADWLASPLERAAATAEALLAAAGVSGFEPRLEPDLAEQDFGAWEGRRYDDIDPGFWDAPATNRPPGGERFADLVTRVAAVIERRTAEAARPDIVAVAHAGVIRAALAHALGTTPAAALGFAVDPLSLTLLEHIRGRNGAWRVVCVNRPPLALTPSAQKSKP